MRVRNICFLGLCDELLAVKVQLNVTQLEDEKDHFSSNVYEELKCSA